MTVLTMIPARSAAIAAPILNLTQQPAPPQALSLITAVMEAMMGRRPLHQLRPHLGLDAFTRLAGYVDGGRFRRMRLGRVRAQMPTGRAVEASVRLACASRWVSCVIRLDAGQRAWKCTELFVLEPGR